MNGTLNNVAENLRGLISDLNTPPTGVGIAPELARLQNETQSLRENLEFLIGPFLNGARKGKYSISLKNTETDFLFLSSHIHKMQTLLFLVTMFYIIVMIYDVKTKNLQLHGN